MRELKFRAWHKERKYMVIAATELRDDRVKCTLLDGPWEHMQYTGLHDADGREVFEGDIVESEGLVYRVEWHDCGWSLYRDSITPGHWYRHDLAPHTVCRVIGNIHKSPELLTGDRG